jgi:hypothetical protein
MTLLNGAAIVALVALSFQIWGWSTETNKPTIRLVYRSVAAVCGTMIVTIIYLVPYALWRQHEPDVRISRIRLSDRLHRKAHVGRRTACLARRLRTPSLPNTVSRENRVVPRLAGAAIGIASTLGNWAR